MDLDLNPGSATYVQYDVTHLRLGFLMCKMGLVLPTSNAVYRCANQVLERSCDLPRTHS